MYKESADRLQGNDAYEGYGIDLIAEIAQILSKTSCYLFRIRQKLSHYFRQISFYNLSQTLPYYTDKKKIKFSSYIRKFRVEQSYMRKRKSANIIPKMRKPLVIYDFATAPFCIYLYMRKI